MHTYDMFKGTDLVIAEKIHRRRMQMLVHSNIYYDKNKNLIDDHQFDAWAMELVELQTKYPDIAKQVDWADDFEDWDGSTGAFLPYMLPVIDSIACKLLSWFEKPVVVEKPKPVSAIRKKLF